MYPNDGHARTVSLKKPHTLSSRKVVVSELRLQSCVFGLVPALFLIRGAQEQANKIASFVARFPIQGHMLAERLL